jgi:hypothetical protein
MAGYSGTPLPKKLGIKDDSVVAVLDAPPGFDLGVPLLRARLKDSGGLWIAWPKKASGRRTDLTEGVVRDHALAAGLVDNKVCAIDEVWSGLRLVVRLRDRA